MSIRKSTQRTFTMAVNGLLAQGKRATRRGSETCVYRAHDGSKCAVGQLIPDKLYKKSFEGEVVGPFGLSAINELLLKLGHSPDFCRELQDCHDGAYGGTNAFSAMCENFIKLAEDEGLTLPKRLRL